MKRLAYVSLFSLALASSLSAAPPKVPGPVVAVPGQVVEVEIEQTSGEIGFHNPYDVTQVYVRDAVPRRDKTICLIIQPKGKQVYRLTVWSVPEKVGTTLIIDASGGKPDDPVIPPGPNPPGPLPDGALGLIKASRDGLAKVASPTKDADAAKLAKAQRGIASAIAAGGVTQPAAILAAWRDANRAAVDGATWKPWGEAVSAALSKVHADGKLPDKAAWVAAFEEIAAGLDGGN